MKQRYIAILTALIVSVVWLVGPGASGAFLTDWTQPDVMSWTDPTGEPLITGGGPAVDGADITEWFFRNDGGNYYFRMDLVSAPATDDAAPEYSFQFDNAPGGDDNSVTGYVASPLTGIDEMLVAHFADATGVWTGWHRHRTTGGAPVTALIETVDGAPNPDLPGPVVVGSVFQSTENGGTTLEWSIPNGELFGVNLLGGVWGATYDINDSFGGTFDITETLIPEPASALLFALFGLVGLHRKRRG